MKTHFDNLLEIVPDLNKRSILDLGSGRGKFLVDLAKRKIRSVGLELNKDYIEMSLDLAKRNGVKIDINQGVGENLPFDNQTFNFVNMSEVIEHVDDPEAVMSEVCRVLKSGGLAYVSSPNRFGIKDPHYHLYFINWLPREFSGFFVWLSGKSKDDSKNKGLQKLSEMHYYTFQGAKEFFDKNGFDADDIKELKIKGRYIGIKKIIIMISYKLLRPWYFDSFHFLIKKNEDKL
jgi:ubiquinone/menaquinone biosynthesis C-methylase UbiE